MSVLINGSRSEEGFRFLFITEEFYTLQGEGCFVGTPAYFVRLAGCSVGCSFCDSRSSWDLSEAIKTKEKDLISRIKACPAQRVVVTGGEPMRYDLDQLCSSLNKQGVLLHLETSGTEILSGQWDWICLSPKKNTFIYPEYYALAKELKVVIQDTDDLIFAEKQASEVSSDCMLYLQVEWGRREDMTPLLIDYIFQNPKWRLSTQVHKYIHIP